MSNRNFTISDINNKVENTGLYKGKLPGQAASKAARKIFEMFPRKKNIEFTIRETTSDSNKKEYKYTATKSVLKKPKIIKKGDVEIKITKEYNVKRVF